MDFAKFVYIPKSVHGETAKNDYESILKTCSTATPLKTIRRRRPAPPSQISSNRKYDEKYATVPFNNKTFFKAAMEDDVAVLKTINFVSNDINSTDEYGWSALMMAACSGSLNAVKFLLNQQVDLTISDRSGNTAAKLAETKKRTEILQLIMDRLQGKIQVPKTSAASTVTIKCEEFFCETCNRSFFDTTQKTHASSTLHRFNSKNDFNFAKRYHIPDSNIGFKIMLKQGWDRESGLGPEDNIGKSYPVKTTIRKNRSGLGVKQDSARITHFSAFDRDAVKWRRPVSKPKCRRDFERDARKNRQKEIAIRKALS